jgi:hypothetical protein
MSNSWYEVVWQSIDDIKNFKYFEWIMWFINYNQLKSDFIKNNNIKSLNNWIIFYFDDNFKSNEIINCIK